MDTLLIPVFIVSSLLLICLVPALLLYGVPVQFALALLQEEGRRKRAVMVSWGLIRCRITDRDDKRRIDICFGSHIVHSRQLEGAPQKEESKKSHAPADFRSAGNYLNFFSRMIQPAGRFVSVIWHECRFEECIGTIRIGTKDPVATGILYGGYWAARFGLMASRIFIDMKPEFNRQIFEMDVIIRLRIRHPLRILATGLLLVNNRAFRQVINVKPPRPGGATKV
jgi:hypothetical protein